MQEEEPGVGEYRPCAQGTHPDPLSVAPGDVPAVPAGQAWHVGLPGVSWKYPTWQGAQEMGDTEPAVDTLLPGGQGRQSLGEASPVAFPNRPAGHKFTLPPWQKDPRGHTPQPPPGCVASPGAHALQLAGLMLPWLLKVAPGQLMQALEDTSPGLTLYVLSGHSVHWEAAVSPVRLLYVPRGHKSQAWPVDAA